MIDNLSPARLNDFSHSGRQNNQIAIFRGKTVRKTIYKKEWWFSILDVIKILSDSPQPKTYWAKMKDRDKEMSQLFPKWEQLKLKALDGKMRETDCANTEGIFQNEYTIEHTNEHTIV